MTVMVTGASGVIGRAAVRTLLARDEVRATVRRPEAAEPLRALGAKVAVRGLEQADELIEILPRCHTLVHLVGGPNQPDEDEMLRANHRSVLTAITAVKEAGTRRFVLISVPGADPQASHPYLRAKGLAEEAVALSGLEHAIIRSTHVYGLGGLWFTCAVEGAIADPPLVPGDGRQAIAPVLAEDLAAIIAAVDDRAGPLEGVWGAEGPDVLTANELLRFLRDDDVAPIPADAGSAAAALTTLLGVPVSAAAASFFAMPSRADAPDAFAAFGVAPTALADGLRATVDAASAESSG